MFVNFHLKIRINPQKIYKNSFFFHLKAMNEDENAGPPLVHCHDGGGRSGTFLAIEANLALVDLRNEVDGKYRIVKIC